MESNSAGHRCGMGHLLVAGPFRVRRIDYPPGLHQPSHSHELSSVTLVLSGAIWESTRHGEEEGAALSAVQKPAGVRHTNQFGPRGARTVQVAFDRERVAELADAGVSLDRWRWLHGAPATGALLALARAVLREPASSAELEGPGLEDRVLEALAALDSEPGTHSEAAPGWLTVVKEALDDDLCGARSVRDLARLAGVHPVSVSRAFRRHHGVTITEYRRRLRLCRAARLAGRESGTLSRVAHAAGYADHPHMCREFRELAGTTPSAYRRMASDG